MNSVELITSNLLSPMVLAFVLGFVAVLLKSDLDLPQGLYTSLSIYLLFAIGLKGGVALSKCTIAELWKPVLATCFLSLLTPWLAYMAARKLGKIDRVNASALAAHYGSVSAVTFIAATQFAVTNNLPAEGFMPALVAVLEVPAILFALYLVVRKQSDSNLGPLVHELLTGRALILLIGGIAIGLISGAKGYEQISPLFGDLFKGALTIFLLEMGLVAGERAKALKSRSLFLIVFGTTIPLLNGCLGVVIGHMAGLSPGGAGVLGAMAASASYIAAPAAVRIALPDADPGLYLTGAIVVTFPFNLVIGIPLYAHLAQMWS
ncbi:MAG: sodium-dependent bicarbonate transport family permease [Armatimonadota bacterium]